MKNDISNGCNKSFGKKDVGHEGNKKKGYSTQLETIFHYLENHTATATMVSKATSIPQKCITRYKRDLEKQGKLYEVQKKFCKATNFRAWYLTTNPELFPEVKNPKKVL
jgi:cysteine synthase